MKSVTMSTGESSSPPGGSVVVRSGVGPLQETRRSDTTTHQGTRFLFFIFMPPLGVRGQSLDPCIGPRHGELEGLRALVRPGPGTGRFVAGIGATGLLRGMGGAGFFPSHSVVLQSLLLLMDDE